MTPGKVIINVMWVKTGELAAARWRLRTVAGRLVMTNTPHFTTANFDEP